MADTPQPRPLKAPAFDEHAARSLAYWCEETLVTAPDPLFAARRLVTRLGAHRKDRLCEMGFWVPELSEHHVGPGDVFVEVLRPTTRLNVAAREQTITFERFALPVVRHEEFAWSAATGMVAGARNAVGDFYRLRFRDRDGVWRTVPDYVAYSVPFGAFAPAEFYDIDGLQAARGDTAYWQALAAEAGEDGVVQQAPATNILQVHTRTGSAAGTLSGLTRIYSVIANKVREGRELVTEEQPYADYDAVQLLPVEPTIEYEGGAGFWEERDGADLDAALGESGLTAKTEALAGEMAVHLRRPDCTNWGYDVLISASSAINPAILDSGRPDELVDLATVLHTFPGRPIKLIFDVVFGHADNQAVPLISRRFFTGPNMYGQDLNYRNPVVRAIMLEMQRRKVNFGADGVRVDGAQDFKWWDADNDILRHDDEYLREMALVEQDVGGCRYRPWMIFEDGRPWPQVDWELSSTYRAVVDNQADLPGETFQWGPLTFAHNTPFLFTFWMSKQWRIEEMLKNGADWISGTANHDTLRRGYQVDPDKMGVNTRLGDTLLEILDTAYDNPSANLFTYGFLPGVPMEFLNASMRASWGFIRNTDDKYGVKVASEEAGFLTWQVDEDAFNHPANFPRLKALGFETLSELRRFMKVLVTAVEATDYDLGAIVHLLDAVEPRFPGPPSLDVAGLKTFARAWMDDLHDYCNVAHYREHLRPAYTRFNRTLRMFRHNRPWLRGNLTERDHFATIKPIDGRVVFHGLRHSPDGKEQVMFLAHMEGGPATLTPLDLPIPGLEKDGWEVAVSAPKLALDALDRPVTLHDMTGLLATRQVG